MSPKPDENSLYEQQENKILAQSDAFISLLTKRGILGDHEIDNTKVRNAQQKRRRTAFHNTQVLLQHYRSFKWILEMMPETIAEELDKPFEGIDMLLEHVDTELALRKKERDLMRAACAVRIAAARLFIAAQTGFIMRIKRALCFMCAATFLNAMLMSEYMPAPIFRSAVWQITSFVRSGVLLIIISTSCTNQASCPSRMRISGSPI